MFRVGADAFVRPATLSEAKGSVSTVRVAADRCLGRPSRVIARFARNPDECVRGYT